ncbi:uroporphyrinogen-III C-methyltransferase [Comamonas sp. NLF-1-9]|uniref:uroporphyrinogen-III C-methyltransferase n=1 Tax=Comamonas sp. NLF-1-9 TaxID=2853163 RepID=UPI001C493C5B|nr:uroporphyrinogen-III C-methyltransferase [Comamonas sp. NLF-1-9]QXL85513.1 uroporphyrinogen-III C-methyltransferase [Comamonas sp. NLF-1-9]
MSTEHPSLAAGDAVPVPPHAPAAAAPARSGALLTAVLAIVALAALAMSVMLWQRLSNIQEQLARQSADAGAQATEARTLAREAQDQAREASARMSVMESRVAEVALQRSQLEELTQSLSRTRDENLIADVQASIALAQQQAELTGSLQPLVVAMKNAHQRVERAAQPRLAPVLRALEQDTETLERAKVTDTAGLLGRLDNLARQVDELALSNDVALASDMRPARPAARTGSDGASALPAWQAALQTLWSGVRDQALSLVRVSRVDRPDAVLLAPEQAWFLRQNLKLQLANARLSILARRLDNARTELAAAQRGFARYFDPNGRRSQGFLAALQQLQDNLHDTQIPRPVDTYSALATAAAGR